MANRTLTKALPIRLPDDVKSWIEAEAAKNSCSQNSEIIRAIRERMERLQRVARHDRGEAA